jgi:4-diphosphocytidyl-2-C-methyl-D-erythritol kinase
MTFRETARAKVNLTLDVLGRRPDGYHELESLVAFADIGDDLELEPSYDLSLTVEGEFAHALAGENLIVKAVKAAKTSISGLQLGRFHLRKSLPVASGLGGGSADAAAALRLLAKAHPGKLNAAELAHLAASLGSDVSVCLASRTALMRGRGELVDLIDDFPSCGAVLVNPSVPLAAGAVYTALKAPPLLEARPPRSAPPRFEGSFTRLIDYVRSRDNALEAPAVSLAPVVARVLSVLAALPGARLVRMSGSGATCFALFASHAEAAQAASVLVEARRDWWVVASSLG